MALLLQTLFPPLVRLSLYPVGGPNIHEWDLLTVLIYNYLKGGISLSVSTFDQLNVRLKNALRSVIGNISLQL